MSQKQWAEGYVDVAERLRVLRDKHPDASLQPADPAQPYRIEQVGEATFVVYVAACYRTPDDPRPGIGVAWESYPGRTPYTRGSELMNAETSAWGRAIVAALAADSKHVASLEELHGSAGGHDATSHATRVPQQGQARPGDTPSSPPAGPPPSDSRLAVIVDRCKGDAEIAAYVKAHWDWPYRDEDLANITAWLAERDATADLEAMATPEPPKSVNRYAIAARHAGLDDDQRHQLVRHITSDAKSSSKDLTAAEGKQFLTWCTKIEQTGELPWGEIPADLEPF